MNELAKRLLDYAKKNHMPVLRSHLPTAREIRKSAIEFYQNYNPSEHVGCPSCQAEQVEILRRSRQYNLQAYQIMTNKEIHMSEKREYELHHRKIQEYLADIQMFEEQSRKSKFVVR